MNYKRGEIINGRGTYNSIAYFLDHNAPIGIGWTDEKGTHLDIVFTPGLSIKCGYFQRGIRITPFSLFVSIIDHTSYVFDTRSIKDGSYIQEKLRMENETGDKLAELINGVIQELNKLGVE